MTPAKTSVRRLILIVLLMLLSTSLASGASAPAQPDRVHGKELAEKLCTNCHLVGIPEQQHANADVPSFPEIANKQDQTEGGIMAHIVLPKHPMPVIPLTRSELADLAAYILSLRQEEH